MTSTAFSNSYTLVSAYQATRCHGTHFKGRSLTAAKTQTLFILRYDAIRNTWILCIKVENADRANSRLPMPHRREDDVTITPDVSKSKVWKSAVQTKDKKNAAGNLISETRKKSWTNYYSFGIHTNITQLYTKTYCWQQNTVLYENINWKSVCHKSKYRTSWHIEHKILCVSGGGRSIVHGTHFLSRLVANFARLIQILWLNSGKICRPNPGITDDGLFYQKFISNKHCDHLEYGRHLFLFVI